MRYPRSAGFMLGLLLLSTPALSQALEDAKLVGLAYPTDAFGSSVSLWGDRALVGAAFDFISPPVNTGVAYVFEHQAGGSWTEVAKLAAADGAQSDYFGVSLGLSGDRALVGAGKDDDAGGDSGSAYVFERQASGSWLEVAKLTAGDAAAGDIFGYSVALSGERALIGASGSGSGAAYVFERQAGGSWLEVAKLTASDGGGNFGYSVSLTGDRALVGRAGGGAYVFERQAGGSWLEVAKLVTAGPAGDLFGHHVSLGEDRALVGAPGTAGAGSDTGSAYVFERQPGGAWLEVAKLDASDAAQNDQLGWAVGISGDRAVVGAQGDDSYAGALYVFERQSDGSWPQAVKLVGDGEDLATGGLGWSAAAWGDRALGGAPGHGWKGGDNAAFVFDLGTLYHGVQTISVGSGGSQTLFLRAGGQHAGELFVLFGSISGTSPGLTDPASGLVLPLNPDAYFTFLLNTGGGGIVSPLFGLLDAEGAADAAFALPPGLVSLAGLVLHHAYVALDPGTGAATLASNAVQVELVP